jgi:predicted signal transduction protein with EAL and GGDEF domain
VNGKQMWVTANYELIDYHGEKCILTGIMDITEIRKAEEELSHYASMDSLTEILNRRMGYKKLEELLHKSKEEAMEFTLCFLNIRSWGGRPLHSYIMQYNKKQTKGRRYFLSHGWR